MIKRLTKKLLKTFFVSIIILSLVLVGGVAVYTYSSNIIDYSISQPVNAKVINKYPDKSGRTTKYYIVVSVNDMVEHTMECNQLRYLNINIDDKIAIKQQTVIYKNNTTDTFYSFE